MSPEVRKALLKIFDTEFQNESQAIIAMGEAAGMSHSEAYEAALHDPDLQTLWAFIEWLSSPLPYQKEKIHD